MHVLRDRNVGSEQEEAEVDSPCGGSEPLLVTDLLEVSQDEVPQGLVHRHEDTGDTAVPVGPLLVVQHTVLHDRWQAFFRWHGEAWLNFLYVIMLMILSHTRSYVCTICSSLSVVITQGQFVLSFQGHLETCQSIKKVSQVKIFNAIRSQLWQ